MSAAPSQAAIAASISAASDLEADFRDVDAVEAQRIFGKRFVAARAHVLDDRRRRGVDVGRELALGGDERREAPLEIRRPHIERHGHG